MVQVFVLTPNIVILGTGWHFVSLPGLKNPGVITGRSSGGMLVYIKKHINKFVKILSFNSYSCWLEIDKQLFDNLDQNLIVSANYSPPINSKYHSQNSYETIQSDLLKFCDQNTPTHLSANNGQFQILKLSRKYSGLKLVK